MKLALHRSIIFWSGLFVMGFVCWAWWDSTRMRSGLGMGHYGASHALGGIVFFNDPSTYKTWFDRGKLRKTFALETLPAPHVLKFDPDRERNDDWDMDGPENARVRYWNEYRIQCFMIKGAWFLFIPHWLILLAVALPWSAMIFWRSRRRKRTITP